MLCADPQVPRQEQRGTAAGVLPRCLFRAPGRNKVGLSWRGAAVLCQPRRSCGRLLSAVTASFIAGVILGGLCLPSCELRNNTEELIPVMVNLNKENANSKFSLGKQRLCK